MGGFDINPRYINDTGKVDFPSQSLSIWKSWNAITSPPGKMYNLYDAETERQNVDPVAS